MSKTAKNILVKSRNKFLADLPASIYQVQVRLSEIEEQQRNIEEKQTSQISMLSEVNNRLKNYGTIQLSQNEVMTKIFSGAKMYLDPRDIAVVPHLVLDGEWEHNITNAWLTVAKQNDVVIDIGANFGYFGILAAQKTNLTAKVILFEANKNLIPYLAKTLAVNSFTNCCKIENLAISDADGSVKLNVLKDYIGCSSLHTIEHLNASMHHGMKLEAQETLTVTATTLDSYCEKNKIKTLDLIKMDIEGYEEKAYEGMRKIIASSPKVTMFIEFTENGYDNPKKFYNKMLKDFGSVYLIDAEGTLFLPKNNDYEFVIKKSADWIMPVFSKRTDLAGLFKS